MEANTLLIILIILTITIIVNTIITLTQKPAKNQDELDRLAKLDDTIVRLYPLIRDEFGRSRNDNQGAFRENREELNNSFKLLGDNLMKTIDE